MKRTAALPAFIISLFLAGAYRSGAQEPVQGNPSASVAYNVSVDIPAETFRVTALLRGIAGDTIRFHFPIWGPGAYDIINFGAYVSGFTAVAQDGASLPVRRIDTNTFIFPSRGGDLRITYSVHDIERIRHSPWFCISDIEGDFVFANTPAIFGYPAGHKEIPHSVAYTIPKGWDISIGLDPVPTADSARGVRAFAARDYDELVDAPIQMGRFRQVRFTVGGKPHLINVTLLGSDDSLNLKALADTTARIVEVMSGFFGEMPYDRYVFQHFLLDPRNRSIPATFGALEHRNSSSYLMPYLDGEGGDVAGSLQHVIAHEYWHLWFPKRVHVRELGPFDYQRPPRTSSLWFAEGLTDYYARILLVRSGMRDARGFLAELEREMKQFHGKPQSISITELSMGIASSPPGGILPLYTKGPILGMLLDIAIRAQTENRKSLDDAMRFFNERYGKTGRSFGDEEIIPLIEEATGARLEEFYRRYIAGREALPLEEYLAKGGLSYGARVEEQRGFGAELERVKGGSRIYAITPGGSADSMGLQVGDIIAKVGMGEGLISMEALPVGFEDQIPRIPTVKTLIVLRAGIELTVPARFQVEKMSILRLGPDPGASPLGAAIRKSMIGM